MSETRPSFWQHVRVKDLGFFMESWFASPDRTRGRILDIPAGRGRDAANLHELGYQVVPADLFPEWFEPKLDGVDCLHADMSERLPFEDASFDYVLSAEGIEHLSDQMGFLAECDRVLRPGGTLFITTPNLLSLRARMAFLFTGNRAFKSFVDEVTSVWGHDGERIYHGHAFLINYFQLRYMLWHNGFRIREVVGNRYGTTSLLLLPLVPLLRLLTRRTIQKARRKNPNPAIYQEIKRDLFSQAMLLSSNLFVVAEKLSDEERAAPVCLPHHAVKLEDAMRRQESGASAS